MKSTLIEKVEKYYIYLKALNSYNGIPEEDVKYVLNKFETIRYNKIFKEQYLNHGDISKSNIICNKNTRYLIDFDETTVTTPLYDFAVIVIKFYIHNNKIIKSKYDKLKNILKEKYKKYTEDNFKETCELYLCKIILEKLYFNEKGLINLKSSKQLTDSYCKYIDILKNL